MLVFSSIVENGKVNWWGVDFEELGFCGRGRRGWREGKKW